MGKEYRYYCKCCGGYYTTKNKTVPLCRGCLIKELNRGLDMIDIKREWGKPIPTPLQQQKWQAARKAQKLLEDSE